MTKLLTWSNWQGNEKGDWIFDGFDLVKDWDVERILNFGSKDKRLELVLTPLLVFLTNNYVLKGMLIKKTNKG